MSAERAGVVLLLLFVAPGIGAASNEAKFFQDMRESSGVDYANVSGELDKRLIVSTLGSGVALFDYDQDGDLDLYFVQGALIHGGRVVPAGGPNRLYRNEGGWVFRDVTAAAGVGDEGWGVGCAAGDYDDDGLPDLYVTNLGANRLYRNRGDGTFEELAERSGVADERWGTSAAFFDADGDGDLDLYVANYVVVDLNQIPAPGREPLCQWFGIEVMCGPKGLPGSSDVFFRNQGNGRFVDATGEAGLDDPSGAYGLGVVTGDYDDDGDLDLYVANDSVPNFLYRNDGGGGFSEVAFLSGVALSTEGLAQAGMGVDMADVNGDGRLDIFVTNFSHESNNVYLNHGGGLFVDAIGEANLQQASWFMLGWGARFADFDNDSDDDLLVANGHVYPGVDETNLNSRYHQRNQLFWNDGRGAFREGVFAAEDALSEVKASRAVAVGDVDDDGDPDAVVVNIDAPPALLQNLRPGGGSWIGFRLIGRRGPRDAIGARLTLVAAGKSQVKEVHPSGSFLSSSDARLHFGLGGSDRVEEVTVRWPGGSVERLRELQAGRYVTVVEGRMSR